jgi:protein-S-isoprenylcysteine O-methyltransferase Ste14
MSGRATPATKVLALACVVTAFAGQLALVVFVVLLGLDQPPPSLLRTAGNPWLIDASWLIVFGLQHSGMARAGFKRNWTRVFPPHLERSLYDGMSGLVLLGLCLTWQPLPGEALWRLPPWVLGIGLAGAAGSTLCCSRFDQFQFFGLRQAWRPNAPEIPDELQITGAYRFVRHPMMACLLVFFWAQPVLTPALALLSGGMSLYILIAVQMEERDLVRRFGSAYESYRRRVPAFVPWRRPVPPARHPSRDLAAGGSLFRQS